MGVDYIEVTTNRVVRAKLNRIGPDRGGRYFLAGACQHFHGTGAYGGEL